MPHDDPPTSNLLQWPKMRTREYDFKSFIKRIVSELTLGQLHNTIGYIYTGSGHKLSV
jgi:hypothetical protein